VVGATIMDLLKVERWWKRRIITLEKIVEWAIEFD
jgi:hypothetical protein